MYSVCGEYGITLHTTHGVTTTTGVDVNNSRGSKFREEVMALRTRKLELWRLKMSTSNDTEAGEVV